ncbi:MAG: hypothetical protein ACKVLL_03270 [Verrucomicrobiales bacterium]
MKTLFLLSCLAAPLLQAGQFDSARVPESAECYLHLDLEEIRESKFGKVIISEVTAHFPNTNREESSNSHRDTRNTSITIHFEPR